MKKRLAAVLLALSCALTCTCALSACNLLPVPGNPSDTGETDNTGNSGETGNTENTGNSGENGNTGNSGNSGDTDNADNAEKQTCITGEYKFASTTYFDYMDDQYITVNAGDVIDGETIGEDYITVTVKPDYTLTLNMLMTDEDGEELQESETADWAHFKGDYIVLANKDGIYFRRNYVMTYDDGNLIIKFEETGLGTLSLSQTEKGEAAVIPFEYPADVQTPAIPEGVQLQDVAEDDAYSVFDNVITKLSKSENASAFCVARLTDYGNSSLGWGLNTIINTTGYAAADGYCAFYDYAYNSESIRYTDEEDQRKTYLQNYVSGCYALEYNGKQYGLFSKTQFNGKDANSVKTTNKYYYNEGIELTTPNWRGCKSSDLMLQRFGKLSDIITPWSPPTGYFGQYSSIYSEDYSWVIRDYLSGNYGSLTEELKIKTGNDNLFISYVLTIKDLFEFELTFYADANATLTVSDVEKQLNGKFGGFSGLSAQDIIDKYSAEFPHATFDKQALTEKMAAEEKIELNVTGNENFLPENLIILGDNILYLDAEYFKNCQYRAVNSLENGKTIIDGGAKITISLEEGEITIGKHLEKLNIISGYIDDTDESNLTLYVYAYDLIG